MAEQIDKRGFFSGEVSLPRFNDRRVQGGSVLGRLVDQSGPQVPVNFAFLVHPRDAYDALACTKIGSVNLSLLSRFTPRPMEQFLKNHLLYDQLARIPPFFISDGLITVANSEVKGNLLAVLLYGEQMLAPGWGPFAEQRIEEAIKLARDKGAKVVGLGAHTSPATAGGLKLVGKQGSNGLVHKRIDGIGITNGNALTAAMSVEVVERSARTLELEPKQTTVGIVGARGSVGSAVSQLLNEKSYRLILNGRDVKRLRNKFKDMLSDKVSLSEDLADMQACDVVLVVTSSSEATILPKHIKPGTIIIDDTQPRNISPKMARIIERKGSIVVDGGYVDLPGFQCGFDLRLNGYSLACLTETFLIAEEPELLERNGGHYSIGDAKLEQAKEIMEVAGKHNIAPAPATCYGKIIPSSMLEVVRGNSHARSRKSVLYPIAS